MTVILGDLATALPYRENLMSAETSSLVAGDDAAEPHPEWNSTVMFISDPCLPSFR